MLKLLASLAVLVQGDLLANDYYERLGVTKDSAERLIRVAFKKKALLYHPDKNPDDVDAHAKMIELTEALDVLADPDLKKAYDASGKEGVAKARKDHGKHDAEAHGHQDVSFFENFALYADDLQIEDIEYQAWEASHSSTETWFINFYSPHSNHCTEMADEWRRVGERFHGMMHVGAVDCDKNFPVCRAAGVTSLPTILLWPKGGPRNTKSPIPFPVSTTGSEGYTFDKFEEFTLQHMPNDVRQLMPNDFESFGNLRIPSGGNNRAWIVGYCRQDCDTMTLKTKEASWIVSDLVSVGMVNCGAFADICQNADKHGGDVLTVYVDGQQQEEFQLKSMAHSKDVAVAAMERLPPLPTLQMSLFAEISQNAVYHEHVKNVKDKPKEYLILFINPSTCDHNSVMGPGTSNCWKAMSALRSVQTAFAADWEYKDLTVTTFNCDKEARSDQQVDKICAEMKADESSPSLVLLKDGALNAAYYHMHIERANEIVAFVQENFGTLVHELLQADFELHIFEEKQTWFVDFNAPWCHHCREVWPEYNLASKHYDLPSETKVHFGKVNCDEHHDMCTAQHIRGYPTFLFYHDGVRHQYDLASRTAEEFVRFIKETLEPVEHEFTPEDYKTIIHDPSNPNQATPDDGERWMLDFFAPWCSHCIVMSPKYREAASVLRGVMKFGKFNCELDANFCMRLGIRAYPTIWRFDAGASRSSPSAKYPGIPDPKLILNFAMDGVPDFVEPLSVKIFETRVKQEMDTMSWVVAFYTSKPKGGEEEESNERLLMKTKALASRYNEKHKRNMQARKGDPTTTKPHEVFFGKFDCRADGASYTFCVKERINKFPKLVFYSGARNQQSILEKDDMLKVISDIDRHIHDDRRELNHPYREKHTFHFHDEL